VARGHARQRHPVYENNTGIVEGIARGEIEVGLVNHYYLYRFLAEDPGFNVANAYLPGDIGGLVNVAGIGVLSQLRPAAGVARARPLPARRGDPDLLRRR
jgi:ABC-type Fe3+ transport system substrate-binding protein